MSYVSQMDDGKKDNILFYRLFLVLFLLSGAAGLIYEVLWVRQFTYVFGASTYAVTIVLATFMMGLGLGSWVVGKIADSLGENKLIRFYVFAEAGIGLYSLMLPSLMDWTEKIYVEFYHIYHPGTLTLNGLKLILAFMLLAIPTTLIGATLPVLSKYIIRQKTQISLNISQLYAVNTIGAILGTVLAGYFLVPHLGVRLTNLVAIGLNFFVAFLFWLVSSLVATIKNTEGASPGVQIDQTTQKLTSIQKIVVIGFCISGVAAMFYEVAWTRALCMILGTTTYAFTTMLATFLLGIALGSSAYRLIPENVSQIKLFIALQLLIGISVLCTIPGFEYFPFFYISLHSKWVSTWLDIQFLRFALAALVMIIPTIALGTVFPVVSSIFVERPSHIGRRLGKAFGLNTFGAMAGAAGAGLILVPVLGMQKTIMLGAVVNLLIGTGIWIFAVDNSMKQRLALPAGVFVALLVSMWVIEPWSPRIINSGAYIYASRYERMLDNYQEVAEKRELIPEMDNWKLWELGMKQYELLYYNPGITATVAVMEREDGVRFLTIDGKTDASTGSKSDMRTQVMIGQLPLLFSKDPDQVLVVGLGSGVTVGSVLTHPVRVVDCAEISPSVVEAAKLFAESNHHALADRRLKIIQQDARQTLLTSEKQYDVIVSQPSNPWINGESSLFSMDWYEMVHAHLENGGLFLQWLPSYLMREHDLKIIIHTLKSVFPNLSIWTSGSVGDLILLAKKGGALRVDYELFLERVKNKGVWNDVVRVGCRPLLLPLNLFVMNQEDLTDYLYSNLDCPLRKNTDDLLITEFSTPKRLVKKNKVSRFVNPEHLRGDVRGLMKMLDNINEKKVLRLLKEREGNKKAGENLFI